MPVTVTTARSDELAGLVEAAARHEFDLAGELPVRAWLFRVCPGEHVLLLLCHHIASDGWSMQVLMADLAAAYAARRDGRVPEFAPLPVQYADYALWQRELLGGDGGDAADDGVLAGQVGYWKRALAGLPEELTLPFDRPRPTQPSQRGAVVRWRLADASLHAAITGLAREHQVTVFMVLHAALAALLSRMGAGTDIPVGAPVAGRNDEAVHNLVGFFVNTLVLRADLSGDPSFAELLGWVRETVLAAQARQDLPFERLIEVLNPTRSPARHPLFQVMIADQDAGAVHWQLPGLRVTAEPVPDVAAKFDLTLAYQQDHDEHGAPAGISASFEYAQDLFDQGSVQALAARLTRLLRQAAASPARPVGDLDLLTPAERRILAEWNDTAPAAPLLALDDPATAYQLASLDADNMPAAATPRNAAYVIYTSGSTGRRKGVVIEHHSLTDLATWITVQFSAEELSHVLAATSLSFDGSVFEIIGTLTAGGSIEIVSNLLALTSGPWRGSMIRAVPTALTHVLASPGTAARAAVVALCGEAVTGQVVSAIRTAVPGARIVNLYGPTEATVYVTTCDIDCGAAGSPPIG